MRSNRALNGNQIRQLRNKVVLTKSVSDSTFDPGNVRTMMQAQVQYFRQVNPTGYADLIRTSQNADGAGLANDYSAYSRSIWNRSTPTQTFDNALDDWLRNNARKYGFSYSRRK